MTTLESWTTILASGSWVVKPPPPQLFDHSIVTDSAGPILLWLTREECHRLGVTHGSTVTLASGVPRLVVIPDGAGPSNKYRLAGPLMSVRMRRDGR